MSREQDDSGAPREGYVEDSADWPDTPEQVAICRDCDWAEDGSTSWVDDVEEEGMVHSTMLAHTVDVGGTRSLILEYRERVKYNA